MKIKNNKGQLPQIGIVMIAVAILVFSIVAVMMVSGNTFTSPIPSLTPPEDGCKAKNLGVRIKGDLAVFDAGWTLVVQPSPESISVNEVRKYDPLSLFKRDYTWEVCLVDLATNNEVACDKGSDTLNGKAFSQVTQEVPYTLDFKVPDNNCDNDIDDFDGKLVATVRFGTSIEESINTDVAFRNGKFQVTG